MKNILRSCLIFLTYLTVHLFLTCFFDMPYAQAQNQNIYAPFDDSRNSIPKGFGGNVAQDLLWQGKIIGAVELLALQQKAWNNSIDLSDLEPQDDNLYWNHSQFLQKIIPDDDFDDYLELDFKDWALSTSGGANDTTIKFVSEASNRAGQKKIVHMMMSDTIHIDQMRGALLRKLGYNIPPLEHIKKVKLSFPSITAKQNFLDEFFSYTSKNASDKWIVRNEASENYIILQDLLLMNADDFVTGNLALRPPLAHQLNNKRILKSISIIYNLIPKNSSSINLLKWFAGRVQSNNVILEDPETYLFETTYEDARWILKKIAQLSASDWEEVARFSNLPGCLQSLLTEKLKARRNSLMTLFDLNSHPLPVQEKVQCDQVIFDGKLVQDKFDGYAASFAFGDPENPLSQKEVLSIFWSKLYQVGFDALSTLANSFSFLSTDIASKNAAEINPIIAKAIAESQQTKKAVNIPASTWNFATYGFNINLSRFITAGPYQGTSNRLSQIDYMSINAKIGTYEGLAGLLPDYKNDQGDLHAIRSPIDGASANVGVSVSYAHISPIASISAGVKKLPFKEAVPQLEQFRVASILKSVLKKKDSEILQDEDLKEFNEKFKPGESFIINLKLGASAGGNFNLTFYKWIKSSTQVELDDDLITRIHIIRKSEKVIQIYQSFANSLIPFQVKEKISLIIPLLRAGYKLNNGFGKTNFYQISLNLKDANWRKNFIALRQIFKWGTLSKLKSLQKPYQIKFKFKENTTNLGALIFSWNYLNANSDLTVTSPQGLSRNFSRYNKANLSGSNYYEYGSDVVDELSSSYLKFNPRLTSYSFNPGWQITGNAEGSNVTIETEKIKNQAWQPFAKISKFYNGFSLKRNKANKILKDIEENYHHRFFDETALFNTQKMLLYSFAINTQLYPGAIDHILSMDDKKIAQAFSLYSNDANVNEYYLHHERPDGVIELAGEAASDYRYFIMLRNKILKAIKNQDLDLYEKKLAKLLMFINDHLQVAGQLQLYGSAFDYYISPEINGFRIGQEYDPFSNQDANIQGNSLGVGQRKIFGPLTSLIYAPDESIDINEGEFFINWLLTKAF